LNADNKEGAAEFLEIFLGPVGQAALRAYPRRRRRDE
jgi:hypothetical protein